MKKLGLIILMALVLTVGGVYATFNYAQADVQQTATLNKSLKPADTNTPKGEIKIDVEGFLLTIDDTTKTRTTGLVAQGTVKVTFTPAKGADALVADEGVNLKLEISFTNNIYSRNGVDYEVFKTKKDLYNATTGIVLGKGTKNESGTFEYTVDLSPYFTVSEIPLPTLTDYNTFKTFFENPENAKVTITVSEVK